MLIPKLHYSYRRQLIDQALLEQQASFSGEVLDLGGKKIKKRGTFRPPERLTKNWHYLNFDFSEQPDIVADAHTLPFQDNSFDWVICTEVLEYIAEPSKMIAEISRVLKPSGKMFLTSPFLYQIHGKPHDLNRFTDEKIKSFLLQNNFLIETLSPQGYFFLVLADFIRAGIASIQNRLLRYCAALLLYPDCLILALLDRQGWVEKSGFLTSFTTGYLVIARKAS